MSAKPAVTSFDPAAEGWSPHVDPAMPRVMVSQWVRTEEEGNAYGFLTGPEQTNGHGVVHGGTLATYMDHTLGRIAKAAAGGVRVATIQLDLHYMTAAKPGDFVEARGRVTRLTKAVIFLRGELTIAGRGVLAASGIWKIIGQP